MSGPGGPTDRLAGLAATRRETEVLAAVGRRLTNREIAEQLCISVRTVESHIAALRMKLGVTARADLRRACLELSSGAATDLPRGLSALTSRGVFVGRRRELDSLHAAWDAAVGGERRTVVVTGEEGVGKSRLVAEFAVAAAGATVRLGRCEEELGLPFQPFAEALAVDLGSGADDGRAGLDAAALSRLIPALAERGDSADPAPRVPEAAELGQLFDAVARYLAGRARRAPTLVVLEDLHWASPATIALTRHVIRSIDNVPLLIVATCRQPDPDVGSSAAALVADLRRDPTVEHLALDQLSLTDVAAMLGQSGRQNLAQAIHRRSGGSAYFVTELVRSLDETQQLDPADRLDTVPDGVRQTVRRRVARLPVRTQTILELAAIAGPRPTLQLLSDVTENPVEKILADLEPAETASIVRAVADEPGAVEFVHNITRDAIVAGLPSAAVVPMHRRVAAALLLRHRDGDRRSTAELARHLFAAAPLGDRQRAIRYLRSAAELCVAALAFDEAAAHYERAISVLAMDVESEPALECDVRAARGAAPYRAGDPRYRDEFLAAADVAVRLDDPARVTDVLLARTPSGFTSNWGTPDTRVAGLVDWAIERLDEHDLARRGELMALKAIELTVTERSGLSRSLSGEAVRLARRSENPAALARVRQRHYWATFDPDDVGSRLACTTELVGLGERLDDLELSAYARIIRFDSLVESGDLREAERDLGQAGLLVGELRQPYLAWIVTSKRTGLMLLGGQLDDGDRLAGAALELCPPQFRAGPSFIHAAQRCWLRIEQGRADDAIEALRPLVERFPTGAVRGWLANAYCAAGRLDDAALELDRVAPNGLDGLDRTVIWRSALHALANVAVTLCDTNRAERLYRLLRPSAGRMDWFGGASYGPSDLVLGRLAALLGATEQADAHLIAAEALCRRIHAPVHLAHAVLASAQLGYRPQLTGQLAGEALTIAHTLGLPPVERASEDVLAGLPSGG